MELPKVEVELSQCKVHLIRLRTERDQRDAELQRLRPVLQKQQADLSELRGELCNAVAKPGLYKTELEEATEEMTLLQTQLRRLSSEHQQHKGHKTQLEQAMEETAHLEAELHHARSELQQRNAQHSALLEAELQRVKLEDQQHNVQMATVQQAQADRVEQSLQTHDDDVSEAVTSQEWRHSTPDLRSAFDRSLYSESKPAFTGARPELQTLDDESSRLRSELLEAQAELDQSRTQLRQAKQATGTEKPDRSRLEKFELSQALAELDESRSELHQVRLQSCAAAIAEDELPKVLEHCRQQDLLLQQLWKDFSTAQEQLVEKGKALAELKKGVDDGWRGGDVDNDHVLASAYSTMKSIRSANTSLRSTMRETMSHNSHFALEGGRSTWGEWPQGKSKTQITQALSKIEKRMSRSQVSFRFDET